MTSLSSILSSSLTAKDPMKTDIVRVSLKSADSSRKAQCDLCKLSYSTEKELLEHCLSLMHHTKLEDREKNSSHECVLCNVTCSNMTDYRRHIMTVMHQKKLCGLKGDAEKKMNGADDRGSIKTTQHSLLSNYGYVSTKLSNGKKQQQIDTGTSEKKIPDTHSKINIQLDRYYQDSNFRYDQGLDGTHSQMWNKSSRSDEYPYIYGICNWSRDDNIDQGYSMETGEKDQQKQQSYEQYGVSSSGYHDDYGGIGGYSWPGRHGSSQDWMRMNNMYQSKRPEDANEIDFTSDVLPTDWDEMSLLDNEQFLSGIVSGVKSSKPESPQESDAAGVGRWYDASFRDRKRPLNRDDIEESFAKSSRSVDSSSDDSIPVRDIPRRQVPLYESSSINNNRPTPMASTNINPVSKVSSIDDTSNNILERAERLCKELREKRELSHLQRNYMLKKQVDEHLNQRMGALVEKQQLYLKGHVTSSKEQQENKKYDSGIDSSSKKQLKQNGKLSLQISSVDSGAFSSQPKAAGKMLKETNKAVGESKPKENGRPKFNFKDPSLLRKGQKGIFHEEAKFGKNGHTKDLIIGVTDKPLSKVAPPKSQLTKDSLMKMVNTPNSRDKRLQLVKILQSREEQKATTACALRTSLQLEGIYDAVFDSKELNVDENDSAQSVSLDDLSFSVRQQILDLIGRDVPCQSVSQSGTLTKSPGRHPNGTSSSLANVIVLSDDEDKKDTRRHTKNFTRMSSLNSPIVLHDVIKTIKKKKTLTGHASKGILKNSAASSLTSPSLSRSLHVNHCGNRRPTSPVQQVAKAHKNSVLHTDSDTLTISDPTESKLEKKQNMVLREGILHGSLGTVSIGKKNINLSSTKNIYKNNSRIEVRSPILASSHIQDQLNINNVVDKFPTLLNICKADRILSHKENKTDILSEVSNRSSEQAHNSPDKGRDILHLSSNLQPNLTALSPKLEVRLSAAHDSQRAKIPETPQTCPSSQISTPSTHNSDKRVLSPSSLPANRTSPYINEKQQHTSIGDKSVDVSGSPIMSCFYKDSIVKDTTSEDLVVNDEDHRKVGSADLPVNGIKTTSSGIIVSSDGSTSQTMSKLLVLSEKEEHVKQEKVTMDLRLTRLHKLLEQAVVQINMCTDRMNQLHEEEQGLLRRRLSLLRDATSVKPNWMPDTDESLPPNGYSQIADTVLYTLSNSNTGAGVSQVSASSTMSTSTSTPPGVTILDKSDNPQSTSLSRTDWLAKFSSYLPKDSVTEANKVTARTYPSGTHTSGSKEATNHSINSLTSDSTPIISDSLSNSLQLHQNFSENDSLIYEKMNIDMRSEGLQLKQPVKSGPNKELSQVASSEPASRNNKQNMELPAHSHSVATSTVISSAAKVGEPVSHSLGSFPIMYVGSFRSAECPMRLIDPVALVRAATESSMKKPGTETPAALDKSRNNVTSSSCEKSGNMSIYNSNFADLLQLSSPPRSHLFGKSSEHGGEESDIGSVASSIASGSSLGEQITRYCKATPGASLDCKEPFEAHELSVILSDTSEQLAVDSQEDENHNETVYTHKQNWDRGIRRCSLSLERLDYGSRKNVYGSLDEKTVKSAEALHLLERNYENSVCPSSISSDTGKRKRRKTKQERDISEFSRRRHNCITMSSSEEEENGKSKKSFNSDVEFSVTQVKGNDESSGDESCHIQKTVNKATSESSGLTKLELVSPSKVTVGSNVTMTNLDFTSPSKIESNTDITYGRHDSLASLDIVDLESVNLRINNLKEMGNGFDQRSALLSKSPTPDVFASFNPSQTDGLFRDDYQLHRQDIPSAHSQFDTGKQSSTSDFGKLGSTHTVITSVNPPTGWNSRTKGFPSHSTIDLNNHSASTKPELSSAMQKASLKSSDEMKIGDVSVKNKTGQYPCDYGPVFDICVGKGQMYVGHVNRGVRVYNMSGLNQEKCVKEYNFPYLQCMSINVKDGSVTLITGNGCNLVFSNSSEEVQLTHDLGTTIKCLLSLPPLVYAGLDTGEVCIYDTMRKAVRDRCICSDRPIHCLAAGQEGAVKLLCVSSQDGTIIVVNAQQCLPIRILTGHTKTAFSIQVEGHLVFSGSGDHTVLIQNLHTAAIEHTYRESKGLIKSVCYNQGYLFTGGMDKLVRCYNIKTHGLVQVYFGADRGVITKVLVLGDLLITGTIAGSVQVVDINYEARNGCHIDGCGLNFGVRSHLFWHLLEDHNISNSSNDYLQVPESVCA